MIINCPSCGKSFEVDENLIPEKGRLLQCGSCDQTWFFDKNNRVKTELIEKKKRNPSKPVSKIYKPIKEKFSEIPDNKGTEIIKYQAKSSFTFSKLLSYILVFVISLIGFILVLDTFKSPLYDFFPNLELLLFNLYETLKDIELFVKDLI
tara:strand:- start:2905 stop:3354 length:450 start_codon:yes stop_codon:yes gene_type:complete